MSASRRMGSAALGQERVRPLVALAVLFATLHACEALQGPTFDRSGFSPSLMRQVRRRRFVCDAGKRKLPLKRVNDNFCDCGDGSDEPGTGACSKGSYYCDPRTLGLTPFSLPASRVGDGLCDCCNGEDEPAGTCANTCADLASERRARLARALEAQRAGLEASAAWNSDVDDVARSIPRQREAAERDAERIRDQLIGLQQQARSAHESTFRVPNALIQQLQRLNTRLQDAVNAARRLSRINSDDFGRDGRWAAVMGRCAESAPLSEKEVKGGSTNFFPKHYVFTVCPFGEVRQRQARAREWRLRDAKAKFGPGLNPTASVVAEEGGAAWLVPSTRTPLAWLDAVLGGNGSSPTADALAADAGEQEQEQEEEDVAGADAEALRRAEAAEEGGPIALAMGTVGGGGVPAPVRAYLARVLLGDTDQALRVARALDGAVQAHHTALRAAAETETQLPQDRPWLPVLPSFLMGSEEETVLGVWQRWGTPMERWVGIVSLSPLVGLSRSDAHRTARALQAAQAPDAQRAFEEAAARGRLAIIARGTALQQRTPGPLATEPRERPGLLAQPLLDRAGVIALQSGQSPKQSPMVAALTPSPDSGVQVMAEGAGCGGEEVPPRATEVRLQCASPQDVERAGGRRGAWGAVTAATEDGTCEYAVTVLSPLACDEEDQKWIQREIDALDGMEAEGKEEEAGDDAEERVEKREKREGSAASSVLAAVLLPRWALALLPEDKPGPMADLLVVLMVAGAAAGGWIALRVSGSAPSKPNPGARRAARNLQKQQQRQNPGQQGQLRRRRL